MLKQIFAITLLTAASLFAQEWDASWETPITDQEQNTATVQSDTSEPMVLAGEAEILREQGMTQRKRGNIFLGSGIGGVVMGGALYIGGFLLAVKDINDTDNNYDNEAVVAMMVGGGTLIVAGGVVITVGIVQKILGGRKIRRADNLERTAFGFTPVIDIPNGRAGGVFTAAF
ncbi:MAG: hypothetical protein LBR60_08305 [Fibrobacter sp.]|jgi:hypothetical protein|nr:hypothetical protein [Fibrobacter sp.]